MKLAIGAVYSVFSRNGCVVSFSDGTECLSVPAEEVRLLLAQEEEMEVSDPAAIVSIVPNGAEVLHGVMMSSYSADKLPAGYTRLEFLQSTGTQYIDTGFQSTASTRIALDMQQTTYGSSTGAVMWAVGGAYCKYPFIFGFIQKRDSLQQGYFVLGTKGGFFLDSQVSELEKKERSLLTNDAERFAWNGKPITLSSTSAHSPKEANNNMLLFGARNSSNTLVVNLGMRVWGYKLTSDNQLKQHLIPALNTNGIPCMFDLVSKQPFRNAGSGQFIAGLTLSQAAQLGRKLPSTGGSLTISLPEGYDANEGVVNSLAQAEAKGWVLTIRTYEATGATAATFSLRRVWVRRQQDNQGSYVAANGTRWQVEWCVDVIGADPESLGYERYRSVDAATEYWGLVPYEYPEEELSTIE